MTAAEMHTAETAPADRAAALKAMMGKLALEPLWEIYANLVTPEPTGVPPAHQWRWGDLAPVVAAAADTVKGHDADHRVLVLRNPNLGGRMGSTTTIVGAIQCVLPGERTTPHRHTAAAVRVILEGDGGATYVDGIRCDMHPGDFVVTPNWTWHNHDIDRQARTVWLDVLDVPFVKQLNAMFGQLGPANAYPETIGTLPAEVFARGGLMPVTDRPAVPYTPRFRYPWQEVAALLDAMPAAEDGSRAVRYSNPQDGGPVTSTLDAVAFAPPVGTHSRPRRMTATGLCVVVEGSGESRIGDRSVAWGPRDIFTLPEWTWASHKADVPGARLIAVTDREVRRRLGLLREEAK
ncbi:MAG: cupin domain-containing protein [Rhodospirillaceae bacterium]|nr:cupin domain-containing protein [Rhodospirillaceae bacterium]